MYLGMHPQVLHLSNPWEDALLIGGVVLVLVLAFSLSSFSSPADTAVLEVANMSGNVTAFMEQHPQVTATVQQDGDQYIVQYDSPAPNALLSVRVDMEQRRVVQVGVLTG